MVHKGKALFMNADKAKNCKYGFVKDLKNTLKINLLNGLWIINHQ